MRCSEMRRSIDERQKLWGTVCVVRLGRIAISQDTLFVSRLASKNTARPTANAARVMLWVASAKPMAMKNTPRYMGCRRKRYGPVPVRRPPGTGSGNGVSERPRRNDEHTTMSAPIAMLPIPGDPQCIALPGSSAKTTNIAD